MSIRCKLGIHDWYYHKVSEYLNGNKVLIYKHSLRTCLRCSIEEKLEGWTLGINNWKRIK